MLSCRSEGGASISPLVLLSSQRNPFTAEKNMFSDLESPNEHQSRQLRSMLSSFKDPDALGRPWEGHNVRTIRTSSTQSRHHRCPSCHLLRWFCSLGAGNIPAILLSQIAIAFSRCFSNRRLRAVPWKMTFGCCGKVTPTLSG